MVPAAERKDPVACVVRRARVEDAKTIARIHVETWHSAYRGLLPDAVIDALSVAEREERWQSWLSLGPEDPIRVWIAEEAGRALGFAAAGPSRDEDCDPARESEIYALYVAPPAWGGGAGRRLLERALDELRSRQFARVSLWVLEGNARARRFYERGGFQPDISQGKMVRDFSAPHVRYRLALATH